MREYLYPQIKKADILPIFLCAGVSALLTGCYGAIHDQITFIISPEYFRKLKFAQFSYLDFGFSEHAFVAVIGFFATWWCGAFIGWCFGRRFFPHGERRDAFRKISKAFLIVLISTVFFGVVGYSYGRLRAPANLNDWSYILRAYGLVDGPAFVTVVYIHIASYAGGLVGFIAALLIIKPNATL